MNISRLKEIAIPPSKESIEKVKKRKLEGITRSNSRIEANKKLLELLNEYLCKNTDVRFIQALWNLGIIDHVPLEHNPSGFTVIDRYYEESETTLKRIL